MRSTRIAAAITVGVLSAALFGTAASADVDPGYGTDGTRVTFDEDWT
ncbi:hypothetical protein [Nonomuraea sp. SYSU D8015]|nr:hypothetical protein [Nonomuraea sp. SYSU D8015]